MKLARRAVVRLGAGAAALPLVPTILGSQSVKAANVSTADAVPLARRLAGYALDLRYEHIDPATIERIKIHLIDSLGCGIGALSEPAVKICREIALPVGGMSTIWTSTTPISAASQILACIQATISRHVWRWPKPSAQAPRN